ncbi:MAG TPA: PQQ-dependent sugar dehydrogenase [Solirubrobacterales bacterium]|nr:PQQ-dependent sugar dehydrogenase [Solirubrobacterales bacterium]
MRARSSAAAAFAAALVLAALVLPAGAAAEPQLPPGFQDEVVFDGLEQPTNFRFVPGPDERIFVAEKPGRILVFDGPEDKSGTVFADLRTPVYDNGDRGLLGLELDPKFTEGRPYVYALYTWDHVLGQPWDPTDPEYGDPGVSGDPECEDQNPNHNCLVSGRLVRLTENALNPDHAVEESGRPKEEQLLEGWCQQFSSHSVGELQFGTEGALYVSGGDGAAYESIPDYGQLGTPANPCGDAPTAIGVKPESSPGKPLPNATGGALRSQNLELLNGAILRIDPDTGEAFAGNPLEGETTDPNALRTIAKGFRNPFRFVFDSETGEIYSGNVGSSEIEEIDRFDAPPSSIFNSGWPCYEGIAPQFQFRKLTEETGLAICKAMYPPNPNPTSLPLFSYSHKQTVVPGDECPTQSGSAVSGLSFYEGSQFPAKYKGALFFADAVRGCVWVMYPGADGKPDPSTTERFLREGNIYPGVKIAEGPDGYLYYADLLSEGGIDGSIHRIAYKPNSPVAKLEATKTFGLYDGSNKFETELDAGASVDPDGKALDYAWDLNEDGIFESPDGETRALTFTKAEQENREGAGESPNRVIAVRVEDDEGFTSIARITLYPGDKPPTVVITEPSAGFKWGVGDEVDLNALGTDAKGNPIFEPLPYYWVTRMAHCPNLSEPNACHSHPLQTFSGIKHAELTAPQHDYPSFIEAVVRVSDKRGLSGTATIKIQPRTVDVSLSSNPPGIELLAGSETRPSPFSTPAIDGSEILISAPPTAVLGGYTYTFSGWSDGGNREHPIKVSAGQAQYTASYTGGPAPPPPPPKPKVPATILGKHPPAKTRARVAKFTFRASVADAKFTCKLDGKPKAPCRSPKTYKRLKPGRHTFKVWATAGGKTDPTPAKFSWKILPPKR